MGPEQYKSNAKLGGSAAEKWKWSQAVAIQRAGRGMEQIAATLTADKVIKRRSCRGAILGFGAETGAHDSDDGLVRRACRLADANERLRRQASLDAPFPVIDGAPRSGVETIGEGSALVAELV